MIKFSIVVTWIDAGYFHFHSSRIQTMSNWGNQPAAASSDEEEGQAYYAGGSKERCGQIRWD